MNNREYILNLAAEVYETRDKDGYQTSAGVCNGQIISLYLRDRPMSRYGKRPHADTPGGIGLSAIRAREKVLNIRCRRTNCRKKTPLVIFGIVRIEQERSLVNEKVNCWHRTCSRLSHSLSSDARLLGIRRRSDRDCYGDSGISDFGQTAGTGLGRKK